MPLLKRPTEPYSLQIRAVGNVEIEMVWDGDPFILIKSAPRWGAPKTIHRPMYWCCLDDWEDCNRITFTPT